MNGTIEITKAEPKPVPGQKTKKNSEPNYPSTSDVIWIRDQDLDSSLRTL